jgi:hypothetical protein
MIDEISLDSQRNLDGAVVETEKLLRTDSG